MGFFSDLLGGITGSTQRDAARDSAAAQIDAADRAIAEQRRASDQALGFLDPFAQLGQQGIGMAGFATDPNAQFQFLQDNPLFQFALDNANQATTASAAAGGRLASGDTLQQLTNNAFLQAQPLVDRQIGGINNLLNVGTGMAQSQANASLGTGTNVSNLLTSQGAARAGGIVGAANATSGGLAGSLGGVLGGGLSSLAGQGTKAGVGALAGLLGFSDPRLKENVKKTGTENGYNIYEWNWNKQANKKLGLFGKSSGVMYPEVLEKNPEATSFGQGFGKVDYSMIGVDYAA